MTKENVKDGDILWRPSESVKARANLTRFMAWLEQTRGLAFDGYPDLWKWSTTEVEAFWEALWRFFQVQSSQPYREVLSQREMPGARWFQGSRLNYTQQVFANMDGQKTAFMFKCEQSPLQPVTWQELYGQVASVAASLREMGVGRGDRVVAFMPNIPQTLIAFLACASLGAVWSSCSPDFASRSVVDRFSQIEPKVLFAVDAYIYGGKIFDTTSAVAEMTASMPTLERVVTVSYLDGERDAVPGAMPWEELLGRDEPLAYEQVPFNHPIWVVYSSGTTGKPKGLVHSQGGVLVEFLKFHSFHLDLRPEDVFFWFSTTGWVMWNIVQGGLLVGAVPILYDGNPAYPDLKTLWKMAEEAKINFFGTSAAFIGACMQQGLEPGTEFDLSSLRAMGSTGSPLSPDGFKWVYDEIAGDIVLGSTSGGTDISSGFLGACPLLPVRAGQLQCRCLGVRAEAWDEQGQAVIDQVGELVISQPMPSMPLYLWNDPDGQRYQESYFSVYPGAWCHGDWVRMTPEGGCVILGRSDSTLNRQGVRMGSADFYNVLDDLPELADSLIVGYTDPKGQYHMPLFVVLAEGCALDQELTKRINSILRSSLSPRHVPDGVFAIDEVPRTINQKKLEVPVINILSGVPVEQAVNVDSMSNPESIAYFQRFAAEPPW
ncbi:MAG: acetoacetate--CoA ligase [Desulfarculaceae bacterium]|nr:acetoacetate--CoA ligase [Desulfarculaceae bacterium]MCF8073217.1 acetoacetate--CoA ligase [Desulfarculaceae bacterium]MCF8100813.1 acetoacetate--CoA ligase [Desulfarculaceae bacterium]MCF8117749.1 acetoacetate--CoA ligase [Desulfarculaceae bacterium]